MDPDKNCSVCGDYPGICYGCLKSEYERLQKIAIDALARNEMLEYVISSLEMKLLVIMEELMEYRVKLIRGEGGTTKSIS